MSNMLAVIVGAGASKDCVAEGSIAEFNTDWRPPLTAELFEPRTPFNRILNKYSKANAISEIIRTRIRNKENLEDILKDLMSSGNLQVTKQVWAVTFYLQELLWTVSENFVISGGTKYDTLIQRLLTSKVEQILFFTLNYDLFLDRAISNFDDVRFLSMDDYCPATKKWSLIKAHGSVNWGRQLLNGLSNRQEPDLLLGSLQSEPNLSTEVEVLRVRLSDVQNYQRSIDNKPLFPALALPATGEKDFVCPKQHLEKTEKFLADCKNFLFVGFSGLDPHILELFAKSSAIERLVIVNGSKAAGDTLNTKLCSVNSEFKSAYFRRSGALVFAGGFRAFMESPDFSEQFLT